MGGRIARWGRLAGLAAGTSALAATAAGAQAVPRDPLGSFLSAPDPSARAEAARGASESGDRVEDLLVRLRLGPLHRTDVPRGVLEAIVQGRDGYVHRYLLVVPESYDPARRYAVRVFLHGATLYPERGPGGSWWPGAGPWGGLELVQGEGHIAVVPEAWEESPWWRHGQVDAIRDILADVKSVYNVDENRVHLAGASDGGAGTYFSAFRDPTPWAAFLPLIGSPHLLADPAVGAEGPTYVPNLLNRPLFIVNQIEDPIHPAADVEPFLERLRRAGVTLTYRRVHGEHDLRWWPAEREAMDAFIEANPRDPYPDTLAWVTDRTDRYNRLHWIVVDELGSASSGRAAGRLAKLAGDDEAGAVRAEREGNTFTVETHRVRRLRLLISPDEVDLGRPVVVRVNGRVVHEGLVTPDRDTLLRWAAVDFDRTMLFAAELDVVVPR